MCRTAYCAFSLQARALCRDSVNPADRGDAKDREKRVGLLAPGEHIRDNRVERLRVGPAFAQLLALGRRRAQLIRKPRREQPRLFGGTPDAACAQCPSRSHSNKSRLLQQVTILPRAIHITTVVRDDARNQAMRLGQGRGTWLPDQRAVIVVGDGYRAAGFQHPPHFGQCPARFHEVLEQRIGENSIEVAIGIRQAYTDPTSNLDIQYATLSGQPSRAFDLHRLRIQPNSTPRCNQVGEVARDRAYSATAIEHFPARLEVRQQERRRACRGASQEPCLLHGIGPMHVGARDTRPRLRSAVDSCDLRRKPSGRAGGG